MPVYLIDKIKPKNSGAFAMVEAEDVSVGEERLDDVLDNKANTDDYETWSFELTNGTTVTKKVLVNDK